MAETFLKVAMVTDWIIVVKVQANPVDFVIVQVYIPTLAHDDDQVADVHKRIEE